MTFFCAGMLEPQKEVMTPGSKTTQKFQNNFMNAILINIFRGTAVMEKKSMSLFLTFSVLIFQKQMSKNFVNLLKNMLHSLENKQTVIGNLNQKILVLILNLISIN